MSGLTERVGPAERWIVQVVDGDIVMVEPIPPDAFVIRLDELPAVAANREMVPDRLAADITEAIDRR